MNARLATLWSQLLERTDYERCERPRAARFDLDSMRRLLKALKLEEFPGKAFHVAGSKGKGSTALLMARGLQAAGFCTGLYSSPHLVDWRERIQVDGAWALDDELSEALEDVLAVATEEETFFDLLTAASLVVFRNCSCDAIVLETGLGGRSDSTNALSGTIALVTTIELEHTDVLGGNLATIAGEKAGIFEGAQQCWSGLSAGHPASVVLEAAAQSEKLDLNVPSPETPLPENPPWPVVPFGENFKLAYAVLAEQEPAAADALLKLSSSQLVLPGRFEKRRWPDGRTVVFDVAHSEDSLVHALEAFREEWSSAQRGVLFALRDDKDASRLATAIQKRSPRPAEESWWTTAAGDHLRSADPMDLARVFDAQPLSAVPSELPLGPVVWLITGSTYLVGCLHPFTSPWEMQSAST